MNRYISSDELLELSNVVKNQKALGRRLIWLLLLPVALSFTIVPMYFALSARLTEVETGTKIVTIERILDADKNYPWAIDQYKLLSTTRPSAPIFARLGTLRYLNNPNDTANALADLEKARQYDHNYWEIYRTLTFIYLGEKKPAKAIEAGERAIEINGFDANTMNNLAWLYATSGPEFRDLNKASTYADKAVILSNGSNPNFLDTQARVYFEQGKKELALRSLKKAIAISRNAASERYIEHFKQLFPSEHLGTMTE